MDWKITLSELLDAKRRIDEALANISSSNLSMGTSVDEMYYMCKQFLTVENESWDAYKALDEYLEEYEYRKEDEEEYGL